MQGLVKQQEMLADREQQFLFHLKKNESFKNVRDSRGRNLAETHKNTFVADMIKHFEYQLQRPKAQNKLIICRIHTSGDFYSKDYFAKWVEISNYFKDNKNIMDNFIQI